MAATTTPLLTALLKKSTLDDHTELLKASNAALKKSKGDIEAQHVKVVALLKLEQYEDAVKFVEECGSNLKEKAALEYGYALYKTGKLNEAVQTSSKIRSRGGKHLEAQATYRLENTQRTAELYKEIRKQRVDEEEFDLSVNQGAIDAQGQWVGQIDASVVRRPGREDLEAFETAYNAACGSIARGELSQAEMLLKRAKELCKHSEDLSDTQKTEELLPIAVQQLYVLQCLGKTTEAEKIAEEITVDSIPDLSTRSIASSNILLSSSTTTSNPFLAHKAFNATPKVPREDRLFSYQSIPFASNQKAIALQVFKFDGLKSSGSRKASKEQTTPSISPENLVSSVYNAAGHAQNETTKSAIQKVLPELEKHPNDVGLIVTLVQMYVLVGNYTSATELVESFFRRLDSSSSSSESQQDIRFNPGLISILISLYRKQGRRIEIKSELAKAAAYWRQKPNAPNSLLKAAGSALLETQDESDTKAAADIFEKLREQRPDDKAATAGYVASHATANDETVTAEADKITPVAELIRNVDVDALEKAGIPQSSNALAIAQLTRSRKRAAADGASSKPKRVRKSRLPKDYDPTKTPDPERWLPLKGRSTYRPPKGKKKNKKGAVGGTQGGVVNEDLDINAINRTASPAPVAGGAAGKKKKGKGKK